VFALAVMLVLMAVGVRFLAVVETRQKISDNERTGLQAALIANAGLERVNRELSLDMNWSGSFTDQPFAGGMYSASVFSRTPEYVVVSAEGSFRTVTRCRYGYVYTPTASGRVQIWGSHLGSGPNEWDDETRLIDSALGETSTFASHKLGEAADQVSLAGFDSTVHSVPLVKVEIVISGYVDKTPIDDYLMVGWRFNISGAAGQWHVWDNAVLGDFVLIGNAGRMYLDVTDDPPPGGWRWEYFSPGTDLQLRCASVRVGTDDKVKLYVDCAGFRVTWGTVLD